MYKKKLSVFFFSKFFGMCDLQNAIVLPARTFLQMQMARGWAGVRMVGYGGLCDGGGSVDVKFWGVLEQFWSSSGRFWRSSGKFWEILEKFWEILGDSGEVLES